MTKKHKTMRGKSVDMGKLLIKHEKEIALGNMNVNAGGDELGKNGEVVRDRNQRIREQQALHTKIPSKVRVSANQAAVDAKKQEEADTVTEQELAEKILSDAEIPVVDADKTPKGGLAASMAEKEKE